MTARVTVSLEKLLHMVEARISSGGERYEAHEATEDMYTSIDKVLDKLEAQIRGTKGVTRDKKRRASATLRRPKAEPAELQPRLARAKTPPRDSKVAKNTASAKSR